MRSTVSKILQVEADRLYEISIREGLTDNNLAFLNKLIETYEKFVGTAEEETPPEEQDTAALLRDLVPKPEPATQSVTPRSDLKPGPLPGTVSYEGQSPTLAEVDKFLKQEEE